VSCVVLNLLLHPWHGIVRLNIWRMKMPKYEYDCISCDVKYEKERSIHQEEPRYTCDQCGYAL